MYPLFSGSVSYAHEDINTALYGRRSKQLTVEKKKTKISMGSFDFIKGIGIIFVILSHTIGGYSASPSLIMRFIENSVFLIEKALMPMFFIISGYRFRENSVKKMLKKTFSELMIPYLIITGAYAVLYPIVNYPAYLSWEASFARSKQFVVAFLLGWTEAGEPFLNYELAWCTAAWFFFALFIGTNVLNLIMKAKKEYQRAAFIGISLSLSYFLTRKGFLLFCIPQGLQAAVYAYFGYLLKKYRIIERIINNVWVYMVLLPIYYIEYKWGSYDMSQGDFGIAFLEVIGTSASGLLLMLLSIHVSQHDLRGLEWVSSIGCYSYWLLSIHAVEMEVIPWYFMPLLLPNHLLIALFCELLIKVIIMTITCILLKRLSKLRYYRRRMVLHGKQRIH